MIFLLRNSDGKYCRTDVANIEQRLRLVQSEASSSVLSYSA